MSFTGAVRGVSFADTDYLILASDVKFLRTLFLLVPSFPTSVRAQEPKRVHNIHVPPSVLSYLDIRVRGGRVLQIVGGDMLVGARGVVERCSTASSLTNLMVATATIARAPAIGSCLAVNIVCMCHCLLVGYVPASVVKCPWLFARFWHHVI